MVRITITYIDPALVEYIILNNTFLSSVTIINDDTNTFISKLSLVLNRLAERKEMLFMVIVTTTANYNGQAYSPNVLKVKIPIRKIALINGSDLRVYPTHDDHILDETIRITQGPVAGIMGYPIAVENPDCTWVIDKHTNALTLDVIDIFLSETNVGPRFWHIPYRSLIELDTGNTDIVYNPYADLGRIRRLDEPPRPNGVLNVIYNETEREIYWEDMSRFIWDYFMKDNDF